MRRQPRRQGVGLPIVEDIDRAMRGRIQHKVPYLRPRLTAKSSTPSTFTTPTGGSGIPRTSRSSVSRLADNPSRRAKRTPARPARASPIEVNIEVS
ncbi:hypothetical protein ACQP2U_23645 [Nocardia sp. CA-084685]|uniref:hypothetical protein n=1 Tax=Nocardia sp. CA-084685 TaxID=3239970 RepID=UPI003D99024E